MTEEYEKMELTADEMVDLIAELELEGEKNPVVYVMDPYKFQEILALVHASQAMLNKDFNWDMNPEVDEEWVNLFNALELFPDWMKDPDWKEDDEESV